ncbi:hypothetical protein QEZ54_02105 [Catellatospora sp. KI3]|uniref:SCO7613 C-terminal domain-containing membrane protein n=1 Tax=Catellatospora sp. KI3 TaxID=3041620 RepID=UPI00248224ED|nr:hypothetical protein [Catellatospora sp. KI3]MDI1459752.1 hypothetical protein [Catellatospora sp. KI3]
MSEPSAYPCPMCGASATLAGPCPGCGRAPDRDAAEVIAYDQRIAVLVPQVEQARTAYESLAGELTLARRQRELHATAVRTAVARQRGERLAVLTQRTQVAAPAAVSGGAAATGGPSWPVQPVAPGGPGGRPEASTKTVQNLLFVLGGLLLGIAAIVFTAVAWAAFDVVGRAVILGTVTLAVLAVPPLVRRRGLTATAETFAALGLLLVLLDGYAIWYVNLGGVADHWEGAAYAGTVAAVTSAVGFAYTRIVGTAATRFGALLTAQPALPLLFLPTDLGGDGWTLVFAAVAVGDLLLRRTWRDGSGAAATWRVLAALAAGLALAVALLLALGGWLLAEDLGAALRGSAVLLVVVAILAAWLWLPDPVAATPAAPAVRIPEPAAGSVAAGPAAPAARASESTAGSVAAGPAVARPGAAPVASGLPYRRAVAAGVVTAALAGALARPALVQWPQQWLLVLTAAADVVAVLALAVEDLLTRREPAAATGARAGAALVLGAPAVCAAGWSLLIGLSTLSDALPWWDAHPAAYRSGYEWQLPLSLLLVTAAGWLLAGQAEPGGVLRRWLLVPALPLLALALPGHPALTPWTAVTADLVAASAAVLLALLARPQVAGAGLLASAPITRTGSTGSASTPPAAPAPADTVQPVAEETGPPDASATQAVGDAQATQVTQVTGDVRSAQAAEAAGAGAATQWTAPSAREHEVGTGERIMLTGFSTPAGAALLGGGTVPSGPLPPAAAVPWRPTGPGAFAWGVVALLLGAHALLAGGGSPLLSAVALVGMVLLGALSAAALRLLPQASAVVGGVGAAIAIALVPPAVHATVVAAGASDLVGHRAMLVAALLSPLWVYLLRSLRTYAVVGGLVGALWALPFGLPDAEPAEVYTALCALALSAIWLLARQSWVRWVPAAVFLLGLAQCRTALHAIFVAPLGWFDAIWTGTPTGAGLSPALLEPVTWSSVLALALYAPAAAAWFDRAGRRYGLILGGLVGMVAVFAALAAWPAPWPAIAALQLLLGVAALVAVSLRRLGPLTATATAYGVLFALLGLAGALPRQWSTIAALAVLTVALGVAAFGGRTAPIRTVAWLAGATAKVLLAYAVGRAADLSTEVTGYLVLAVAAVLLALAYLPRVRGQRVAVEAAAHSAALVALTLCQGAVRPSAAVLALWGVAVGLTVLAAPAAQRVPRAALAAVGEAVAWCLLLDAAGVGTLEAYTLPVALLALAVGLYAARTRPDLSSWLFAGPALVAALLPSLAGALTGESVTRRLLLGAGALAVVVFGSLRRWQAPVVLGGGVLLILAAHELVLVVRLAPSWVPIAVGGAVLLALAITYERRRRDMARLRAALGRMR